MRSRDEAWWFWALAGGCSIIAGVRDPRVKMRGERIGAPRELSTGCGAGDVTAPPWGGWLPVVAG